MDIIIILLLIATLAAIGIFGYKIASSGSAREQSSARDNERFESRLREMEDLHKREMMLMREHFEQQRNDLARQHSEQVERIRRDSELQFESISRRIFEEEKERLHSVNREGIDALLAPLKARMEEFQRMVTEAHASDVRGRANLAGQVEQLMKLNVTIGEEARNLTMALKGDSKVQGDWGEQVLTTLLEKGGLVKGIHYDTQLTRDSAGGVLRNDEGRALRPDAVIYLPDRRTLIVDSKVSLTAFVDYCNANTDEEKRAAARRHLDSVKKHIKELADKHYQKLVEHAAEHVIMFMPVESAYLEAVRLDSSIWSYAYERKVAIVTPSHLFSTMQIVSQLWTRDDQNRHVAKIAEAGGRLYDKLALFCRTFEKLDGSLNAARAAYDEALSQLCTGRGNALRQAAAMKELGAKVSKSIPQKFAEMALDNADEECE